MKRPAGDSEECGAATTVEELVRRWRGGCGESFSELVRRFRPKLLCFLRRRVPSPEDAEDIVQETFARALERMEQYNAEYKFSTWLFTMAVNLANSHYRRRRKSSNVAAIADCTKSCEEHVSDVEERRSVWAAARALSSDQYEALWLRYAEGMTIKRIADVMGKSETHVKVILFRARAALAKKLRGGEHQGREAVFDGGCLESESAGA